MTRQEMVLTRRAMKARWPIADVVRRRVIKECRLVLEDEDTSSREKLAAGKLLLLADRLNLEQEKRDRDLPPPPSPVTVNVSLDLDRYAAAFAAFAASLVLAPEGGGAVPPDRPEQPLDPP